MKLAIRVVGAVLAVVILAIVIARIDVHALLAQLATVGPGFAWILVLHLAAMIVAALPWRVLLPPAARPSVVDTIASRFLASGANAALPVLGIGGEIARLLWLRKPDRPAGTAALLVDRIAYGIASLVVLALGLVGLLHAPALREYLRTALLASGVLVALIAIGTVLVLQRGITARLLRLLRRDAAFGDEVDAHLTRTLRAREPRLWLAVGLHVIGRALIGAEIVVGFALLGAPLPWDQALVFAALPVIVALAGAVVPSQVGVHEGAQALVAASLGISPTTAVAVIVLVRLRQLAGVILVGPYLLLRHSRLLRIKRGTVENPAR